MMSSSTTSNDSVAIRSSATSPLGASSTAYPWRSSRRLRTLRLVALSSTTSTRGPVASCARLDRRGFGVGAGAGTCAEHREERLARRDAIRSRSAIHSGGAPTPGSLRRCDRQQCSIRSTRGCIFWHSASTSARSTDSRFASAALMSAERGAGGRVDLPQRFERRGCSAPPRRLRSASRHNRECGSRACGGCGATRRGPRARSARWSDLVVR